MSATNTIPESRKVVESLEVGDTIKVNQYANPLTVTKTTEMQGDKNAMVGLEFATPTGANKHLITNQNSKRIYLMAGSTDKGEVTDIQKVA